MTFNNLEIPIAANTLSKSTWFVYDGPNIAVIHDGVKRYIYIKNINTAVVFPEPFTSFTNGETAFIIGSNNSNLYFLNSTTQQLRAISVDGVSINEQFYNINDFNKLKDIKYGLSGNTFIPTCGHVTGSNIVLGGYMEAVQPGVTISGKTIANGVACYMYSDNNGSSFKGPFFPFINPSTNSLYIGKVINCLFINDNWVFYVSLNLGSAQGTNLNFIQSLGVDFIGNNIFDPFLETPNANENNFSLPMVYFDNKIFYQSSSKAGYFVYNYVDNSNLFNTLSNITGFSILPGELRITRSNSCDPVVIPALQEAGAVTIANFNIGTQSIKLRVGIGKTYIKEIEENNISPLFTNSSTDKLNTSHFLQPATLDI